MDERALRELIGSVEAGRLSRRDFTRRMIGMGLTGPLAAQLLGSAGQAQAQARPAFNPTKRGGGGELKVLWWQAVSILNPHLSVGVKDNDGSRLFYEPLASFDPDGNLVPILAAEMPTVVNGAVAKDGLSVTWKLKRGVQWHDGKPFTADDVVFTWEFAADPATAATSAGAYRDVVRIDKLDSHTVKVVFKSPTPFWPIAFCGTGSGMIIPKHVFESFRGVKSREAPANLKPVGTGAYRYVDFKPNDVVRAELNPNYHVANRPFFDRVEMKGGGDAVSAARAVIQTGEYDFAWNLQVEDDILKRMEQGGKGHVDIAVAGNTEHINVNQTDPYAEVDGEKSSLKTKHLLLSDPAVRQALTLIVDRGSIQEQVYGRLGQATANYINAPARFQSKNTKWEFNVEKANKILDEAGWKRGADGIRAKEGKRLKFLFQTSINAARQKQQAIVKQAATKAGIDVELKTIVASVFFGSDPGNPDTLAKFGADLQMYAWQFDADPQLSMRVFASWEVATKENRWAGRNTTRWRNEEFDRLYRAAEIEMDPVKRAAHFIRMNDLVVQNVVVVPLIWRSWISGVSNKLKSTEISGWDSSFWNLPNWYREA
jgi:peptide/nickel transport system substrate-binding protein